MGEAKVKLMEAAAVYLIVGSVLIGPISPQQRSAKMLPLPWPWGPADLYEEPDETCKRALNDIGAQHVTNLTGKDPRGAFFTKGDVLEEYLGDYSSDLNLSKSGWFLYPGPTWGDDSPYRVTCIPVPSGLY